MTEPSEWMMLLRTLLSLGAVIALIYALSWFAKKYLKPQEWATRGANEIKLLQTYSIDSKKKLLIVEVRAKQLLLGVTENSISLLSKLDEDGLEKSL